MIFYIKNLGMCNKRELRFEPKILGNYKRGHGEK
jgi:hypothetical protein